MVEEKAVQISKLALMFLGCALLLGGCKAADNSYYSSRHDLLSRPAATGKPVANSTIPTNAPPNTAQ
jgi:hypothetical protein